MMKPNSPSTPDALRLAFVRHGATQPNLDGVRCGGDLDVPLTPLGREQVRTLGLGLQAQSSGFDVVVTSDLRRTLETARLLTEYLRGARLSIEPLFRERALGAWNLQPTAATEGALLRGDTPPGGEAEAAFERRIATALASLRRCHGGQRILLVGSKGVARMLRRLLIELPPNNALLATPETAGLQNAARLDFLLNSDASAGLHSIGQPKSADETTFA